LPQQRAETVAGSHRGIRPSEKPIWRTQLPAQTASGEPGCAASGPKPLRSAASSPWLHERNRGLAQGAPCALQAAAQAGFSAHQLFAKFADRRPRWRTPIGEQLFSRSCTRAPQPRRCLQALACRRRGAEGSRRWLHQLLGAARRNLLATRAASSKVGGSRDFRLPKLTSPADAIRARSVSACQQPNCAEKAWHRGHLALPRAPGAARPVAAGCWQPQAPGVRRRRRERAGETRWPKSASTTPLTRLASQTPKHPKPRPAGLKFRACGPASFELCEGVDWGTRCTF